MFHAIGNFCYRFRWIVIALWIVVFGVSVAATPFLADTLTAGFTDPNAPSEQSSALIQETFKQGETNLLVVFQSDTLQAASEEFKAAEQRALDGLTAANIAEPRDHPDLREHGKRSARLRGRHEFGRGPQLLGALADGAERDAGHQGRACGQRTPDLRDRRPGGRRGAYRLLRQGPAEGGDSTVCRWRSSLLSSFSAAWCRRLCRSSPAAWRSRSRWEACICWRGPPACPSSP